MSEYSHLEWEAGMLFFQDKQTRLDYPGYCEMIQQSVEVYLQLLYDDLERIPDAAIAHHAIAISNLLVELQQML